MFQIPPFFRHVLYEKGYRYAYNYLHYLTFYYTKQPALIRLLQLLEPYPAYIEIENTTACNLKCRMCEHTYWDEKPTMLSFEQFRRIVDQFPWLKWIGLTGIGESYLNKDFHKMLRYCKRKRLIVEIYDAFFFVGEEESAELIDLGIDQIYCSMDAATRETYETIRVGSDFERVVSNLRTFIKLRNRQGRFFPVLDFHFIINKINQHEIIPYIELIADIAPGSKIQFTRLLHCYPQIEYLFTEIDEDTMHKAQQRCGELGVEMFWNQNVGRQKAHMTNCVAWYMPFIFATGEVIPCCSGNEANRRTFQKETALGNIFEQSFHDIWYGKRYKQLRSQIREGFKPDACNDCCMYAHSPQA